jgi:hypothetical protein
MNRSYSQLLRYLTFEDRFKSYEWKKARRDVVVRDQGCDLGIPGYEINGALYIHHMNPMSVDDIVHGEEWIFNPEYLISTTQMTHNAIHFGDDKLLPKVVVARYPHDTKLW